MSNSLVVREVCKDVWTFSCPFSVFGVIPIGGRSTAIRLRNGDVWVLPSTPLCHSTRAKLDELGPVKYIISPNSGHWTFVGEFKRAYPEATLAGLTGPQMVADKCPVKFDGVTASTQSDLDLGFEDEIWYRPDSSQDTGRTTSHFYMSPPAP
ncbi:hypothetical protein HGRIS_000261 [Hohenbuehelia grisea]|uniref:DUF4336 domain-containing protein n=1 Tax=Hohenbuehelia grisea TaxID=104357 RepID=A0ABR3JRF5_9AGAR